MRLDLHVSIGRKQPRITGHVFDISQLHTHTHTHTHTYVSTYFREEEAKKYYSKYIHTHTHTHIGNKTEEIMQIQNKTQLPTQTHVQWVCSEPPTSCFLPPFSQVSCSSSSARPSYVCE